MWKYSLIGPFTMGHHDSAIHKDLTNFALSRLPFLPIWKVLGIRALAFPWAIYVKETLVKWKQKAVVETAIATAVWHSWEIPLFHELRTFPPFPLGFLTRRITDLIVDSTIFIFSCLIEKKRFEMKYVLVTGGVVSGLGKGVTASSIGVVLKACGLRVTSIKIGVLAISRGWLLFSMSIIVFFFGFPL